MKVGDIVRLSAYGKRLNCNQNFTGRVGLVVEIDPVRGLVDSNNAVMVNWSGSTKISYHIRRDLKHAK